MTAKKAKQAARKPAVKARAKPKAPTPREKRAYAADNPRDYANGRHAAKRGIPKEQAPAFFNEDERKAWLEGHDSLG